MKNLALILALLVLGTSSFGQSRDESSPTPVTGTTIRATLVDDVADSYQIYYYSMNLAAGRQRATIRSRTRECNGANVSVYVNGTANVSTASCDIPSNTSTGEYDFDVETAGNKVIAIYVTGGNNERFEVELVFSSRGGPYIVGTKDEPSGVVVTPVETGNKPDGSTVVVAPSEAGTASGSGGSSSSSNDDTNPEIVGYEGQTMVCSYSDEFVLSIASKNYARTFDGIVFKRGTVYVTVTATSTSAVRASVVGSVVLTQISGVRAEPRVMTDIGGRVITPVTDGWIRETSVSGSGYGQLTVKFANNRSASRKTVSYRVVVRGSGIATCA